MNPYRATIELFQGSGVPYVIIGGFALVMHGSSRFTPDVNVVVELDDQKLSHLVTLLGNMGELSLTAPEAEKLCSAAGRAELSASGKRMVKFLDTSMPNFSVDIFVDYPIPFEPLVRDSTQINTSTCPTYICSVEHLFEMKRIANRLQDKVDLETLEVVQTLGARLATDESVESLKKDIPENFGAERVMDLKDFARLSPDERMDWLQEMLTNLGKFCII